MSQERDCILNLILPQLLRRRGIDIRHSASNSLLLSCITRRSGLHFGVVHVHGWHKVYVCNKCLPRGPLEWLHSVRPQAALEANTS